MGSKKGLGKMGAAAKRMAVDGDPLGRRVIEQRLLPDPMVTDALVYAGRRERKVQTPVNMVELIGGLARIEGRTDVQEAAAARFRLLHERAQLGGARAIDYTAVRVDTSGCGDVVEFGERARREYADAVRQLGMIASGLVERVVVYDLSLRAVVGQGGRNKAKARKALLEALDQLSVHFQLAGEPRS